MSRPSSHPPYILIAVLVGAAILGLAAGAMADLPASVWPADKNVMYRPIPQGLGINPYSDQLMADIKSMMKHNELRIALGSWTMSNYLINGSNYQLEDVYVSTGYCPIGQWINDVPFPTDQVVKCTPLSDTDDNTDITDAVHGVEYSFWRISADGSGVWQRNSAGYYECENAGFVFTNSSGGNPMSCSLRGPSLSHTVGLIYPEELEAGVIDHGLCSAIPGPSSLTIPPATKTDGDEFGRVEYPNRLPEIAVYRLKPSIWTDQVIEAQPWNYAEKVVAKAARDYGIWITDNSGTVHLYANNIFAYQGAALCNEYDPYASIDGLDCSHRNSGNEYARLWPIGFIGPENFEVMDTIYEPYPKPDRYLDYDGDGMLNAHETAFGYHDSGWYPQHDDPSNGPLDWDNDGISNADECRLMSNFRNQTLNPLDPDTDGDGYTDFEEAYNWSADPTNPYVVPDPAWPGLPSGPNLALGKTTSGTWPNGSLAVDGNENTEAVNGGSTGTLIVDLGSIQTISRVVVKWALLGNYYARGFDIDVSTNGSTWTTIDTVTRGDGGLDDAWGWTGSARYVRLNVWQEGTPWGMNVREMEVYGGGTPQPPVANFSGNPTSGTAPLNVMFTDLSTNSPTSWSWTFGDTGTSALQNPSHTYAAGTYTVSLEACNAQGCDTETKTNYITASTGGSAPVADFVGSPTSGTAPLNVSFTDLSTNSPTSWSWTFGDTGTSALQNPSHSYAAGTYTVSLQATNAYGSDTEIKTNYITASSGGGDFVPSAYTVQTGTYKSGGLSNIQSSDNTYLVVGSVKSGGKQTTEIEYTFSTGLSSLSSLSVTHEWHISATSDERQKTRLYNFSSGGWDEVDNRVLSMNSTDQTVVVTVPSPANYISSGQVRVWLRCGDHTSTVFDQSVDLVKITAAP
jgi:PKD repeat protein